MNGEVALSFFATSNKILHNFHGKQLDWSLIALARMQKELFAVGNNCME